MGSLAAVLTKVPPLLAVAKRVNGWLKWLRWRVARPAYPSRSEIRLHLGCGDIDHPGFVNVDARPGKHVHHVQGVERMDLFRDDSVALIYTSHCLEHISHRRVPEVLKEWHRVLKPGGILRVSVPDFDLLVDTYLDNDRNMRSVQLPLMGSQDYAFNFHYTCFNHDELSRLMQEAGFEAPRRWQHGADEFTSLPDWSGRSMTFNGKVYPVSLNLEAVK